LAPTLAVGDGGLTLRRPGVTVEILHFRAHTRGDLVVFVREAGALLTGDLLDELPYFGDGYPREWASTLDRLAALDFEVVVPGHGGVVRGKELLLAVRDLLGRVVAAAAAAPPGTTPEALLAGLDLGAIERRLVVDEASAAAWEQGLPGLAERALAEARGELERP
jgi:glyoxylase-like metal-dependent hydrolase (beta-lactamase superfamily II)